MAKTSNYLFKLDLMILSLLKEKDQYAYELTKEIAENLRVVLNRRWYYVSYYLQTH